MITLTAEQRRAWKVLRPVLSQVLQSQLEEERSNPFVGEISHHGYHASVVQPGRVEMLDELIPEILDPIFGEPEPEKKRIVGLPFSPKRK